MRTTGSAGDGGTRAAGDGVRTPLCGRTRRRGSGVLAYRGGRAAGDAGRGDGWGLRAWRDGQNPLARGWACTHGVGMSLVQLQAELSKLSPQEQLVLADLLVMHAEKTSEPSPAQNAELNRRYTEALAKPESLLSPDVAVRRLQR